MLISQCDRWGCCDGNRKFKSGMMGDGCNLRSASASSLFRYFVCVIIYRENPDSQRKVAGNDSSFLTAQLKISVWTQNSKGNWWKIFALKLHHSQCLWTANIHRLRSLPIEMREWKNFSANYCQYCWVENISPTSFESAWDAQLYDVLHLDAAWLYSSRYSFIVSKTINCILLHTLVRKVLTLC